MKTVFLVTALYLLLPLFSDEALKRTDDPEVLHQAAMNNMELQAKEWEEIARKEQDPFKKKTYTRLAESYRTLILLREEQYLAEKNNQPVHYEKVLNHSNQNKNLAKEASELYGKGAPELPEEVKPKKEPVVQAPPVPPREKSYTTESGFEVKFRLED